MRRCPSFPDATGDEAGEQGDVAVGDVVVRYQHIDALFGGEIDWDLIATHAQDMIQVALSIQAGWVMPSMLLRKLGTYSRRSLLYRAFRELGRVERTLFLLRFVSSVKVRRNIRAETTKIEAFNDSSTGLLRRAGGQER
jgi:TnpA family transposase